MHSGRFCLLQRFVYTSVFIPEACHPQNDLKELKHGDERDAKVERQGSANVADEGKSGGPVRNINLSTRHS